MRNRCVFLVVVSLAAGLPGCAATRMSDSGPAFGSQAWNQPSAPPQRTIASTVPTASVSPFDEPTAKPVGLAKYFPNFQRPQPETAAPAPRVVARYRPTWFGLRPNPAPVDRAAPAASTTYMTDSRAALARPYTEPSSLPVALQVPSANSSTDDGAVRATTAERPMPAASPNPADVLPPAEPSAAVASPATPTLADFGGKPSKPGEDEINPLPPAIGSTGSTGNTTVVTNRMPEVPPVDPIERVSLSNTETTQSTPAATPAPTLVPTAPSDDKTQKAITPATNPPGVADAAVPASFATVVVAQNAVGFKKHHADKVLASPQIAPTPQSAPKVVAKPTPQSAPKPLVKPTSQTMPTSQAVPTSIQKPSPQASAQTCEADAAGTTWKRPCLRRLVRKVWHLGEYADPPTAAPH